jgi:hypothetical protein
VVVDGTAAVDDMAAVRRYMARNENASNERGCQKRQARSRRFCLGGISNFEEKVILASSDKRISAEVLSRSHTSRPKGRMRTDDSSARIVGFVRWKELSHPPPPPSSISRVPALSALQLASDAFLLLSLHPKVPRVDWANAKPLVGTPPLTSCPVPSFNVDFPPSHTMLSR